VQGPLRLLAGPGTGKTHALVSLYEQLVASGAASRAEILVLTFSTSAADELSRRIDERLRDSYSQAWISTFHSFCAHLLRDHRPPSGAPPQYLLNGFQEWVAMKRTLEQLAPDALGSLAPVRRSDAFAQDALAFVALLKQNLVHPASFALLAETAGTPRLRALAAIYSAYQQALSAAGMVDFRDLVADTTGLLGSDPRLAADVRRRFRYILVDEFQDVDPAQFELLRLLAPPESAPNLVVVGDPDQSIYGFRGTVPGLLGEDFTRAYGAPTDELVKCRRCPADLLDAAERLLAGTQPARTGKGLETTAVAAGPAITTAREATAVDEAFYVAREIKRRLTEGGGRLRPSDFAILLRSTTALAAPFEEALRALGVEHEVRGLGALARNEVLRFLLAYLRGLAAADPGPALVRLLGSTLGGVSPRALSRLKVQARAEGREPAKVLNQLMYRLNARDPARFPLPWGGDAAEPLGDEPPFMRYLDEQEAVELQAATTTFHGMRTRARDLPLASLAYAVLIEAGVVRRLLDLPLSEAERLEAMADLRAAVEAFRNLDEVALRLTGAPESLEAVAPRLEAIIARAVDDAEPAAQRADAVQILTIHQAKGLEFEIVFLSALAQGVFPVQTRPHPLLDEEEQAWLEAKLPGFHASWPTDPQHHLAEEARLAYVAMTRARNHLYLTYADEYESPAGPSPFIALAAPTGLRSELTRSADRLDAAALLTRSEAEVLLAETAATLTDAQREEMTRLGVDADFVCDPASGRPYWPFEHSPPAAAPPNFSATALTDYLKCPRIYWYKHHPGLAPVAAGPEAQRGGFIHKVLEDFHVREADWRHRPAEEQRAWLEQAIEAHLEVYLARMDAVFDRKREEHEVRRILENYMRFATSMQRVPRRGTVATEKRFWLQFEGAEIHGVIDRINDTGGGTCEVVDYKTGRGMPASRAYEAYFGSDMYDVQMVLYYLACRDGVDADGRPLGLEPRFLSLWYPKDQVYGAMRQVLFTVGQTAGLKPWQERVLDQEDLRRGQEVVAAAIAAIRSGDFRPKPRDAVGTCLNYTGCDHALVCPFARTAAE
jgi:DNA helicase-2/ATP-dependent DNA helicase PcrA